MKNPLFDPLAPGKINVFLEPLQLLKNPNLLNQYYGAVQPLLIDALSEVNQITQQLEGFYKSLVAHEENALKTISAIRACDYRLYKIFFELAHSVKDAQTKKYSTRETDHVFMGCLTQIAHWYDQFLPLLDRLFMKLSDFEDALIHVWKAYDLHPTLFNQRYFVQGQLVISLGFAEILFDPLKQLIHMIEYPIVGPIQPLHHS